MPLVVFVLLLVLVLLVVGFACACFSDQPLKSVERTLGNVVTGPALVEMWAALVVIAFFWSGPLRAPSVARGRASPTVLQCFLR